MTLEALAIKVIEAAESAGVEFMAVGAVAAAAATQAESSNVAVFHPAGNIRASYFSMPWNSA